MPKAQTKTAIAAKSRAKSAGKPKVTKTNSPRKKTAVAPVSVDSTLWRESRVPVNSTISKGNAMKQYRLKASDLASLDFDEREIVANGKIVYMHLYKEREVERKAWERHGGPEAFEGYLEKLRKTHIKKFGKYAPFRQPPAYEPAGGAVYIVRLAPGPPSASYDPHVGKSPKLLRLKQEMPRWLWDACHRAMDREDDLADPYEGICGRFSRTKGREGPMELAASRLAKSYPARPAALLPPSAAITHLRNVLAEAPRMPRGLEWGADVDGMEKKEPCWPDETYDYDWGSPYLDRLFGALIGVIEAHGTGDAGWGSVRWEVYDKYSDCFNALSYDSQECRWFDHAAQWLDGQYTIGTKDISNALSARSKSSLGKRYNSLLPYGSRVDV